MNRTTVTFVSIFSFMSLNCGNSNVRNPIIKNNAPTQNEEMNELTPNEVKEGWILLFDGNTTDGWRGFQKSELSNNWIVEDGSLKSEFAQTGEGDIVYAAKEFENFELKMEWKIAAEGNSGIMYHVSEDSKYDKPWQTGPEYQLIDDFGYGDQLEDWQTTGNDYAMYAVDDRIVNPHSEWNSARIVFTTIKVTYYLNSKETVSFVPWSTDWESRKQNGKWKDYPDYGILKTGLICLQDHGSDIWFRNIRIKEL